jgi:hypothetical protein
MMRSFPLQLHDPAPSASPTSIALRLLTRFEEGLQTALAGAAAERIHVVKGAAACGARASQPAQNWVRKVVTWRRRWSASGS